VFLVVLGLPLGMSPFLVLFIGKVQHICIRCLVQLDAIWLQALLSVLSLAVLAYGTSALYVCNHCSVAMMCMHVATATTVHGAAAAKFFVITTAVSSPTAAAAATTDATTVITATIVTAPQQTWALR
jgi:hypothetical protein